jgi:hypothetical protein
LIVSRSVAIILLIPQWNPLQGEDEQQTLLQSAPLLFGIFCILFHILAEAASAGLGLQLERLHESCNETARLFASGASRDF